MTLIRRIRKAQEPPEVDRLRSAQDSAERRATEAFLAGLATLRDTIPEEVLSAVDVDTILAQSTIANAMQPFEAQVQRAVARGAELAASAQPPVLGPPPTGSGVPGSPAPRFFSRVDFVFDSANPKVTEIARTQTATRIREVGEDIRTVARSVVDRATNLGINPRDAARELRDSIGLTSYQEQVVRNYRQQLEAGSLEALDRELRDRRFDGTVRRAARTGQPLSQAQIDRMVNRYRERWIKYRAETIARTESIRALAGGQHALFESYIENGQIERRQVRRFWHATAGPRTRDWHRTVPGMNENGVAQDEPFRTELGPLLYPGDPAGQAANVINCRCVVFSRVVSLDLIELQEGVA